MTIKEAILTDDLLGGFSSEQVQLALDLRGINSGSLAKSSLENLELVRADLYSKLLISPDFSEGSLSIKYDKIKLEAEIKRIAIAYNDKALLSVVDQTEDSIEDITDLW